MDDQEPVSNDQEQEPFFDQPNPRASQRNSIFALSSFRGSEVQEAKQIETVMNDKTITEEIRETTIHKISQDFNQKTRINTSCQTISSIFSTMFGINSVFIPLLFIKYGTLTTIIASFLIGLLMYKTTVLGYRHAKLSHYDYQKTIKMALGESGVTIYRLFSLLQLLSYALLFFLIQCNSTYYGILNMISDTKDYPSDNDIRFDKFSYQYVGIICIVIQFCLMLAQKLPKLLEKVGKVQWLVFLSLSIILLMGCIQINLEAPDYKLSGKSDNRVLSLFGEDNLLQIIELIAILHVPFAIQSQVVPIIRENKKRHHNQRDMRVGFNIVVILIILLGFFGSIAVFKAQGATANPDSILSLFNHTDMENYTIRYIGLGLQVVISLQMIPLIGVLLYLLRHQFFTWVSGKLTAPSYGFIILFNFIICGGMFVAEMFNTKPLLLMGIMGAFVSFPHSYLIPILVHLKCLRVYQKKMNDSSGVGTIIHKGEFVLGSVIAENNSCLPKKLQAIVYILELVFGILLVIGYFLVLAGYIWGFEIHLGDQI